MVVAAILASCTATPGASPSASGAGSSIPTPAPSLPELAPMTMLIDTDAAGDDLVALAFLLSAPHVEIAAITVSGTGEAHCGPGVDVVLRLLELLDAPDIPAACGRETPLLGEITFPDEWRTHVDGGSGLDLPATDRQPFAGGEVELIRQTTQAHDQLVVLTLGPLTNLADAVQSDAAIASDIAAVFVMGGAVFVPGNVAAGTGSDNEVAEWNIYVDPRATNLVLDASLNPVLVSLDGTNQVPVTAAFAARVADEASAPAALVLAELFAANPYMTDGTYYLWDPLAAMLGAGYPVGSVEAVQIAVEETNGAEWGFTRPLDGTANATYLAIADATTAGNTLFGILNAP